MGDTILLRRGTKANLPALQAGEPGWSEDSNQLFIGSATGSAASAMPIGDYDYAPESFTQASIEATLALIGTVNKVTLLLRPGTWVISSSADWSAYKNVTFKIVPGALLQIATGTTTTIPVMDESGLHQRFNCVTTGKVVFGSGAVDSVRPEWFATNTTPGTTDMHVGFEKAIECMFASQIQTLKLSSSKYYFAAHVEIANAGQNLRITGEGMAGWLDTRPLQSEISGVAGLDTLFLISANYYGLEIDHVRFDGGHIVTGVGSAIKSTAMGYPARPFNIHHCNFNLFAKAIYSSPTAGGGGTGIAQINIRENTFYVNTYAVYGDNNIGSITNMNFIGNVSEQGGKIKVVASGAGGTLNISDNVLEGQSDVIQISAGFLHAAIQRNYFESNTGDIVSFLASNSGSTLKMGSNYYLNSSGARVTVSSAFFETTDDLSLYGILLNLSYAQRKTVPKTNKFTFLATPSTVINNLDISSVLSQRGLPATLGGAVFSAGTDLVSTPLGLRGSNTFTTNSAVLTATGSLSIGDFVVVTALVQSVDATTINVSLYDNASAYINESGPIPMNAVGEYTLVHAVVKALATSTGTYKVRFISDTGKIAILTDPYIYTAAAPTGATAYYAYLPMLEAAGQATITNPATTTVVTHGMAVTPRNITLIPGANLGHCWVSTVGATQFTVNVETTPGASAVVYWRAN